MEYSSGRGMSVRQVMKRTVVTSTTTTSSEIESDRGKRSMVEMTTKQAPGFPRHDVKMFARDEFSTMSSGSFSNGSYSYGSVYERSFTTKTIGGGGESRRFIEHITKPAGREDEDPIVLVRKERSQIDVPEWMRERKSPNSERRDIEISNINAFLRYPSDCYSLRKRKPEADRINEGKIRPEVAKRDKTEIPLILDDDEEEEERITKPFRGGDEHPIVLVRKERSQIDVPEWMEERKSPNAKRRGIEISNINAFLRYPSDYFSLRRRTPEADRVNESKIRPEVAKRDKTEIPMILDDDEEEEEESDEEYDEFEEEIVIVDVRRKPIWRKGLEIPKPQPQKAGVPIEDLLEIPTLKAAKQESAPDKLIDEKIDSMERPPVVYAELPDLSVWEIR